MTLTDEDLVPVDGVFSRWVRLPGGVRAHYVTSGASGPAVVLLHGGIAGSSGLAGWRFMAPYLGARGFRVYCPDLPGFGLTSDAEGYYAAGPGGHLDFLHDFTTALGLDEFHLGGNSLGCRNAVNYLVAHPERVRSFALIAGSIGDLVPDPPPPSANGKAVTRRFDGTAASMRAMLESIVYRADTIDDELVEMRTRHANRSADAYARHQTGGKDENTLARLVTRGRLERLTIPGIYLYGRQDVLVPFDTRGYAQEDALPAVQFFYPDECGHQGQTDQPDLFNDVFGEFFSDGRVSRATADRAGVSTRRPELPTLVESAGRPEGTS